MFRKYSKLNSNMSDTGNILACNEANWEVNKELLCSDVEFEALAREVLAYGKPFRFTARGSSMQPFILDGDEVNICSVDSLKIRLGDILFARTGSDALVAHRVIRIKEDDGERLFELQGDDCNRSDGFIAARNVLGKVCQVRRGDKFLDSRKPVRKLFGIMQILFIRWLGKRPVLPLRAQKILERLDLI